MTDKPTTWLRAQINERGSSRGLARHLGVSRQAVDAWANGQHKPSDGHAAQLADWLEVPETILRQRLRMPTYSADTADVFKAGVEHGFGMVVRAIDEAMKVLDADSGEVRRSS